MPGHDGVAAGARSRARSGAAAKAAAIDKDAQAWSSASSTSSAASPGSSSRRSNWRGRQRRRQSPDRRRARRGAHSGRAPRSRRAALPRPQRARPGRHRQSPRRLHRHRPSAAARARGASASSRGPTRRRPSMRVPPAIAKRCRRRGRDADDALVARLDPADRAAVSAFLDAARPDAIVCANDRTAGQLMQTLLRPRPRVPRDIRLAGIDDVEYAALLPVPLTTLRQPTRQMGDVAIGAMLERVARTIWRRGTSCCRASWSCARRRARSEDLSTRRAYSWRSARVGSRRAARVAGIEAATRHAATMISRLTA